MLVSPRHNAVFLKLRNIERVKQLIPTAREVLTKAQGKLLAVPHRLDEVRVLKNIGINAPSPILTKYEWSGRLEPFAAQKVTAAFLTKNKRAFVLNEVGTGKSLATLWAYDYLRKQGEVKKMLVVAPLSTLERTWGDEVFKHFLHLDAVVLHGSKTQRLKLLNQDADIYIINHDGVKVILDELQARDDIDIMCIDEISHCARNASTDRWKALNALANKGTLPRAVWGLTGTPTPNAPTDAWAQCRLVVPDKTPKIFMRFRDQVMRQQGPYKWIPRDTAVDTVNELMQPAVRFKREDCVDLPDCMYVDREVQLTAKQEKAYKQMTSRLMAEAEEGQIIAVNEAVKMSKLVQIACGVVYSTDGEEVSMDASNRLKVVDEIIEENEHKLIIFVPFKSTINMIVEHLESQGHEVGVIHGGVGKAKRDEVFRAFQSESEPRILVAQPAAMSHGLTLTAANTIIWYAPVTSNETYEQANGRITRPGQVNKQYIIHLEGTPIERRIYKRLKEKQSLQGLLLETFGKEG
jgi:SNF2 family DNA or RNA helicase